MLLVLVLCLLLPAVQGNKASEGVQSIKTKYVKHVTDGNLRDIPSSEINTHILHTDDNKDKLIPQGKTSIVPNTVEIKPINHSTTSKSKTFKNNKSKLKKWRSKMKRKQLKELIKKNIQKQKRLKKMNQKNKKTEQKRNKQKLKRKKQERNTPSSRLSKVIDRIMSYHRGEEGAKLTTQEVREKIFALLTGKQGLIKAGKDCPKPKLGKPKKNRQGKKQLRSLNRGKVSKKRPRVSVTKKDGNRTIYKIKDKKGNVRSKITIRVGKKDQSKKNKKERVKKTIPKKKENGKI